MRKILANLAIALGAVVGTCGLIGTPVIKSILPADLVLPAHDQAVHHYFRVIPAATPSPDYLPYTLLIAGLLLLVIGFLSRRRLRDIAA